MGARRVAACDPNAVMDIDIFRLRISDLRVTVKPNVILDCIEIAACAKVIDSHTGRETFVAHTEAVHPLAWEHMGDVGRAHHIRARVRDLVWHEVDECLFIDGKCVFDPHPEDHARP